MLSIHVSVKNPFLGIYSLDEQTSYHGMKSQSVMTPEGCVVSTAVYNWVLEACIKGRDK